MPAFVDEPVGRFMFACPFEAVPHQPVEDRPDAPAPIDIVGNCRVIARHRGQAELAAEFLRILEMLEEMLLLLPRCRPAQQWIEAGRRYAFHEAARPQAVGEDPAALVPEMRAD